MTVRVGSEGARESADLDPLPSRSRRQPKEHLLEPATKICVKAFPSPISAQLHERIDVVAHEDVRKESQSLKVVSTVALS